MTAWRRAVRSRSRSRPGRLMVLAENLPSAISVTDFEAIDPYLSGSFSNFARLNIPGGTFRYVPDRTAANNRKFRIDAMCTATKIVIMLSTYRADLDLRAVGWLQGERLLEGSTDAVWPNGKVRTYGTGSGIGDDKGRVTISNSSLVMTAATFASPDVEFGMGIKVGSDTARVGVCFRVMGTTEFLGVVLTSTQAIVLKNVCRHGHRPGDCHCGGRIRVYEPSAGDRLQHQGHCHAQRNRGPQPLPGGR